MNVSEIVDELAKGRAVEKMIKNITDGKSPDTTALQDLAQDIYLSLLTKGEKLITVYEEGHMDFYLSRVVMNNIASSSSPYYRIYIKPTLINTQINENILNKGGEN